LIALIKQCPSLFLGVSQYDTQAVGSQLTEIKQCTMTSFHPSPSRRLGGFIRVAAPDPIPNSAVKRSGANGTSSQDAGE
jgi:hypothetical protein